MFDLRVAAAQLIENPLVPVPPMEGVVARARRYRAARLRRQAGVSVLLMGLMVTAIVRAGMWDNRGPDSLRMVGEPASDNAPAGVHIDASTMMLPPPAPGVPVIPTWGSDGLGSGWQRLQKESCPPTVDPDLDPVAIMANDLGGIAPEELSPFEAIRSVVQYYNFLGGICGHAIKLVEGSIADVDGSVVGIVGTPLDPALDGAIADRTVDALRIPVIGGDGLTRVQYGSRFVFPVGTPADALTRIALDRASSRGARSFAIVYDGRQPFAREALESFNRFTGRIGGTVRDSIDVSGSETALVAAADRFRQACDNGRCDFVLLALGPDVGHQWLQTRPPVAKVETAALPTLLTGSIPESCFRTRNEKCDGLTAWTGFTPWFEQNRFLQKKVDDSSVKLSKGSALVEATALSTRVLVQALLDVGPKATRRSLATTLEKMVFSPDPNVVLRWGSRMPRVGNPMAQRWRMDIEGTGTWARDAKNHSADYAQRAGGLTTTFADGVATWGSGQPRWLSAMKAYAEGDLQAWRAETAASIEKAAGDWTFEMSTWSDDKDERRRLASMWLDDLAVWSQEQTSKMAQEQKTSGAGVPMPSDSAPLPSARASTPSPHPSDDPFPMTPDYAAEELRTPLPDKWWAEEGDWRTDPG